MPFRRFAFAVGLLLAAPILHAATTYVWDGGHAAQDRWSLQQNWNPNGDPPNDGAADLVFAGTIRLTPEADGAAWNINSMAFNSTAGAFSLYGSTITLQGASVTYALANNSSNLITIGNALTLASNQSWNANTAGFALDGAIDLSTRALTLTGSANTSIAGAITGTGSILKTGAGTLTLTGANSYSGGTTVSAGTLSGTTTSLQGNIANNAALIFEQTTNGTYAGVISGTGSLTKLGTGTTTLSNSNTYTGATTISGGTLALAGSNSLADTTAVSVNSGATLQLTAAHETVGSISGSGNIDLGNFALTSGGTNASTTFSGSITGTGGLTKNGTGTLTLTGPNTYSGGTTVNAGTLTGSTTSLQGNIANNAALVFDQSANGTYAGSISGTGTFTKENTGTLTLTGVNTYTGNTVISGGALVLDAANALSASTAVTVGSGATLQLSAASQTLGSLAGSGSVNLGAHTLTAGGANTSTTFSGAITGSGALVKDGTGTFTLTGANSYSGGTTVNAGTLAGTTTSLQGNIANNAAVVFDQSTHGTYAGVISGTGSLTKQGSGTVTLTGANILSGATTISGGTLALGASNTLSAASNLTLNAATTLDLNGHSVQVGSLAYHTAIIDFGTAAVGNAFLFTGGGTSTGTLTINNYNAAQGDIFGYQSGASISSPFLNGVYFYGIGGGTVTATGQTVAGYSGTWDFITPNTTPFKIWDGGGGATNTWNTASNWDNDIAPVSSTTLKLAFAGAGDTPVMNGSYTVNTLRFNADAGAFSLTASGGGSTLTFGGSVPGIIQLSSSNQSINVPISLSSTTVVEATGAGTLTLAGVVSGSGGLMKLGENTLILSGANTYSGATTINEGTIILRNGTALGSTADGTSVSSGATLQLENNISVGAEALALGGTLRNQSGANTYGGAISGSGSVAVNAGTLTFNGTGANTYSGATTVNAGQLDLAKTAGVTAVAGNLLIGDGAGAATVRLVTSNQIADTSAVTLAGTGTPVFNINGQSETIGSLSSSNAAAAVQLGSGSLATGGDNSSTTFAGIISGTGSLTKQGTGTFTLENSNTYTGATTVSAGTLIARNSNALGTAAGGVTVASGAALQLENSISIGAEALALNGTLRSASGTNTYGGTISGSGSVVLDTDALTLSGSAANTYSGTTTVNSGQLDLAKTAGQNAVSGSLVIGNGAGSATVRLVNANQIADTAAVTLGNGGTPTLNLNNNSDTIGSLASVNSSAAVQLGSGTLTTGGNNASTTFAGIISGTGGLTKQGTGTFTLGGANTYTGTTTVSAGTLALGASNVIADTSNLTLGAGATLALGGSFSERVGTLSFTSATIDFGAAGTANHFLISNVGTTSGTLTIANWTSGTDIFGVATNTVSQSFLDNLYFSNLNVGIGAVLSATPVSVGSYGNFYTLSPIPTFIWDGGQSNGPVADQDNWNQANNWSGNIAPGIGAMKAVVMAGSARLANDMNGAYQINSLLFNSSAGAFTISSSTGDTLTIGGGGINNQSTAAQTLSVPIALSTAQTWTAGVGNLTISGTSVLNGAHTLTIAGDFNTMISAAISGGSGGLVKNGAGTVTLSGTNTFTGGVTLNAGVISISADANLGAASGALTFSGGTLLTTAALTSTRNLTLNSGGGTINTNGFDSTFSGNIDGSGALTKTGAGTVTLSGTNTFTGGVTLNGGVVSISADANLGATSGALTFSGGTLLTTAALTSARNLTLNSGGGTINTNGFDSTFSGNIDGAGALTKIGAGTLTLAGTNNTFAGGTTLSAGTLRASSATLAGNVLNNAALVFDQATAGAFSGAISGSGSVTKQNTGTLTLTGANSYSGGTTISGGTLQGSTTSLQGNILNNASLVFDQPTSASFSGVISGTGSLTKQGAGTLTLAAVNTYTGSTTVLAGALSLGASSRLASTTALVIGSGATFDLAGFTQTVGSLAGAGTLALGSGTLVAGTANTNTTFSGAITGAGVLEKVGSGTLTFDASINFAGELRLSGGTLALSGANLTVGTLRITGNTVLDFGLNTASVLTASNLIIENGAVLTINNWVDSQDYFFVTNSIAGINGTTTYAPFDIRGAAPLNQLSFTGFAANTTIWMAWQGQVTPAPEPSTYGAVFTAAALALVLLRRRPRSR